MPIPARIPIRVIPSRSRSRSRSSERLLSQAIARDDRIQQARAQHWKDIERSELRGFRFNRAARIDFTLDQSALNSRFQVYDITFSDDYSDLVIFLAYLKRSLRRQLLDLWHEHGGISWSIKINLLYVTEEYQEQRESSLSSSHMTIFTAPDVNITLDAALGQIDELNNDFQEGRSNWIIVDIRPSNLYIRIARLAQGVVGSGRYVNLLRRPGSSWLPLPAWINSRKCVINVKNSDMKCFAYAMEVAWKVHFNGGTAGKDAQRPNNHLLSHFNYADINFPFHPLDLDKFERLNKSNEYKLIINVFHATDIPGELSIIRHPSKDIKDLNDTQNWVINLLIVTDEDSDNNVNNTHWCYIMSLEKLMRLGQAHTNKRRFLCTRCLKDYTTEEKLAEHQLLCGTKKSQVEVLPKIHEAYRYFKDTHKKTVKPFVIYADFESFNKPMLYNEYDNNQKVSHHLAASYCFQVVCRQFPELNWNEMYSTEATSWENHDPIEIGKHFIDRIMIAKSKIQDYIAERFSHEFNGESVAIPETECCICNLSLKKGYMRHWAYTLYDNADTWINDDGDAQEYWSIFHTLKKHNNGTFTLSPDSYTCKQLLKRNRIRKTVHYPWIEENNYRGECHLACYSSFTRYGKIPVVFHNLSGYDGHLIMQSLDASIFFRQQMKDQFNAIPQAGDKFMSFSFCGLEFLDSFRFLSVSLDELTDNLRKSGEGAFKITQKVMSSYLDEKHISYEADIRTLLMKKGQFPYEWFDNPSRMLATKLPSIDDFYNTLRDEKCSPEKYQHAQEVWVKLECHTFRDYHDIYLLLDVILLSDIFENFRTLCSNENNLEPLNYISLPGYTFDSALLYSKLDEHLIINPNIPFEIELFHEGQEDMYEFVEDSIRGGISMTPGRYARANNRFMAKTYNPEELQSFINYYDANNLYGFAMSQYLPFRDYEWCIPDHRELIDQVNSLMEISTTSNEGYIYEVDGFFPDEVHDYLADFPPVPVNESIRYDITSDYYKKLCQKYKVKHDDKTHKLLCNLLPKTKYKVYYRSLQQYIALGFVITQIHRRLKFTQTNWLAKYIMKNTNKRALTKIAFEKDFYKLLNNATYGKTIQNNRKFQSVKAIGNENYNDKNSWDPSITHFHIVNENLVLAYMKRGRILLNSPIIIGSVVLDQSKWLMYNFWYQQLKPTFGSRLKLLFTDTDSLCTHIISDNVMKELADAKITNEMDLADWPKDDSYYGYCYYDEVNKKVIGKFKDESAEDKKYIQEIIALRSKMYSIEFYDTVENKKTAKGVSKAIKKQLNHLKYLECLASEGNQELVKMYMHRINSINNQLYLSKIKKVTLSPHDNKSYLVNSIDTLPYGHYKIRDIHQSILDSKNNSE